MSFLNIAPPTTEMTKSPLSGVGGGGAYIDRTVDKTSFVKVCVTVNVRTIKGSMGLSRIK